VLEVGGRGGRTRSSKSGLAYPITGLRSRLISLLGFSLSICPLLSQGSVTGCKVLLSKLYSQQFLILFSVIRYATEKFQLFSAMKVASNDLPVACQLHAGVWRAISDLLPCGTHLNNNVSGDVGCHSPLQWTCSQCGKIL